MNINTKLKQEIIGLIHAATGARLDAANIQTPPKPEMGDFAVPLFSVASALKHNPAALAVELAQKMECPLFSKIVAVGPYVNFYINTPEVAREVIQDILKSKNPGAFETLKGQKVMIEYFSPNTNKPMTVGHLRNLVLGSTISRLYQKAGAKVIQATLFNDRGIAIAKSMLAYELFGNKTSPQKEGKKPDQFVGDFYVMFGREAEKNVALDQQAQEMVRRWEAGDKKVRTLWQKMNSWVYMGYAQTLNKLKEGNFDITYYESDFYDKAKEVVYKHLGKGVIKQGDDGVIFADLSSVNLPNKILLRNDGTSLYITQDLYLAFLKDKKNIDQSIIVVADEQNLQMEQLFAILKSLDTNTEKYQHLSYGMMRLPEGKIKSREGFGRALADALIEEMETLAIKEVQSRHAELPLKAATKIANQVMIAAIKFYILNVDAVKSMIFNPQEAMSFTGKTGPYLQYTVVRLRSILSQVKLSKKFDTHLLTHELERQIITLLSKYETVLSDALTKHTPSHITHYMYELAQVVNHYYHDVSIMKSSKEEQAARVALISCVVSVLTDALAVCGIEVPEKM